MQWLAEVNESADQSTEAAVATAPQDAPAAEPEFYENIYRLKQWPWPGMRKNRYSVVAYYTRDLVYERLGSGILQELERKTQRTRKGSVPTGSISG